MNNSSPVTLADVQAAAAAIKGAVDRTPARHSLTLSKITGCEVFLKFENFQFTASFKERGVLHKLLSLSLSERAHGVIAASAGNHAQAVAYQAGRLGIRATIVMPVGTPFNRVKFTQDFGARVILEGANLPEAIAAAEALAAADGLTFVHPYDDAKVIAGHGTITLELLEDLPQLDTLVVPVGGGGLIAGIAVAAKALRPEIALYGVESVLYPSMHHLLTGDPFAAGGQTIAETLAVTEPGKLSRRIVAELVDEILLAQDVTFESAVHCLAEIEKTVVEAAGAAGLAAIMENRNLFAGRKVGVVLSGGNIDMRLLSRLIVRELSRDGRIQSLVVASDGTPGVLAKIASVVEGVGGTILEFSDHRPDGSGPQTQLGVTIEARDVGHAYEIRQRLQQAGFELMGAKLSGVRGL